MDFEALLRRKVKESDGQKRKQWLMLLNDLRTRHTLMFKRSKPKRMRKAV